MRTRTLIAVVALMLGVTGAVALASINATPSKPVAPATSGQDDPIQTLVNRLTLDNYKSTLKGLTQFGDRRQGTQRNRDALDWIEAQLQSFVCTNTERITYTYPWRRRATSVGATRPDHTDRRHRRPQRLGTGRQLNLRLHRAHRRQPRPRCPARRAHPGAQR